MAHGAAHINIQIAWDLPVFGERAQYRTASCVHEVGISHNLDNRVTGGEEVERGDRGEEKEWGLSRRCECRVV